MQEKDVLTRYTCIPKPLYENLQEMIYQLFTDYDSFFTQGKTHKEVKAALKNSVGNILTLVLRDIDPFNFAKKLETPEWVHLPFVPDDEIK